MKLAFNGLLFHLFCKFAALGDSSGRDVHVARTGKCAVEGTLSCTLLRQPQVGIVTAAGYPGEAEKFERRLAGLLETFRQMRLAPEITNRCLENHSMTAFLDKHVFCVIKQSGVQISL
jgi:hypothetical protein